MGRGVGCIQSKMVTGPRKSAPLKTHDPSQEELFNSLLRLKTTSRTSVIFEANGTTTIQIDNQEFSFGCFSDGQVDTHDLAILIRELPQGANDDTLLGAIRIAQASYSLGHSQAQEEYYDENYEKEVYFGD